MNKIRIYEIAIAGLIILLAVTNITTYYIVKKSTERFNIWKENSRAYACYKEIEIAIKQNRIDDAKGIIRIEKQVIENNYLGK